MADEHKVSSDIYDLGGKFLKLQTSLKDAHDGLGNIQVQPGDFADADTLKTTVASRAQEAQTLLQNISDGLGAIGTDLQKSYLDYDSTEANNTKESDDVATVVKDTDAKLPGLDKQNGIDQPQPPTNN